MAGNWEQTGSSRSLPTALNGVQPLPTALNGTDVDAAHCEVDGGHRNCRNCRQRTVELLSCGEDFPYAFKCAVRESTPCRFAHGVDPAAQTETHARHDEAPAILTAEEPGLRGNAVKTQPPVRGAARP